MEGQLTNFLTLDNTKLGNLSSYYFFCLEILACVI